ncbi:hypothetical protein ACTXT7_002539 [Hymenolepis weldensis]
MATTLSSSEFEYIGIPASHCFASGASVILIGLLHSGRLSAILLGRKQVDEEGAEAAAATGISIMPVCIPPKFIVDHPFLFLIITFSGVPAFMGHVLNPLANQ